MAMHVYQATFANGVEDRTACVRCGLPSTNSIHPFIPVQTAVSVVLDEVRAERANQDKKFGITDHTAAEWLAILTEEVGEAAHAMLHPAESGKEAVVLVGKRTRTTKELRGELIQIAAVAVSWVEAVDRELLT